MVTLERGPAAGGHVKSWERIAEVAESTRRSLSQEHAQHLSVWQDWEAAYQRMTTDVTAQLDSVEQQRQTLQAEADRLSLARTELQRVRSEHEQARKALHNGQSKSQTETALTRGVAQLVVFIEDCLEILLGNADAGIPNLDPQYLAPSTAAE